MGSPVWFRPRRQRSVVTPSAPRPQRAIWLAVDLVLDRLQRYVFARSQLLPWTLAATSAAGGPEVTTRSDCRRVRGDLVRPSDIRVVEACPCVDGFPDDGYRAARQHLVRYE